MTGRTTFLTVAGTAAQLVASPEVASAWEQPSALAKMSVRSLAGHLAAQVFFIPQVLAEPVPGEELISLTEYYARAAWIGSDLDDEFNTGIRDSGEKLAAQGPQALVDRLTQVIAELSGSLEGEPSRAVRRSSWGPFAISLDDFVASRLLEVVIHSDDLAHSVGLPTPSFPDDAVESVVDILSRIALRRHGQAAVLRALSRAERAPEPISAL